MSSLKTNKEKSKSDISVKIKEIGIGPMWTKLSLCLVISLCMVLNYIGMDWGRTGLVPWSPDSIEGSTTVREMPRLFGQWIYKYPRGQFLINAIFYKPLLNKWQKNPVNVVNRQTGRQVSIAVNLPRLDILAMISRWITYIMSIGIILALFLTVKNLFTDNTAAVFATLALTLTALFIFYSKLGNIDIPYIFWFAWGTYWAVKSIYSAKWRHFLLMGFCFAYSFCTKDAGVGFIIGVIPAYWLAVFEQKRRRGASVKSALAGVFSLKILAAAAVFLFVYALMQGIFFSPAAYFNQMSYWLGGRGVSDFNKDFRGQWPLFIEFCTHLYSSLGWPLLIMTLAALIYCGLKYPYRAGFAFLPAFVFYVLVVVNVRMTPARYFLPAYFGTAIVVGKAAADFLRWKKLHIALRILPIAAVFGLSLLHCIALDMEMLREPRIRAEQWFVKNVDRQIPVACLSQSVSYAPRLHIKGFTYYICPFEVPAAASLLTNPPTLPPYLIYTVDSADDGKNFKAGLEAGLLDYKEVVRFENKYIWPGRHILGIASWGVSLTGFLDRGPVTIYKKLER